MRNQLYFAISIALAAVFGTAPARADVSMTMHTTMHSAMMDKAMASMSADMKNRMTGMLNSKIYMSGKRYRMDNSMFSMVMDAGTKQMTMFSNFKHTYCVIPADPDTMKGIMDRTGVKMPTDSAHYNVVDTGKTTQFLGHKCRHYIVTMTMEMPNAGTMTSRSDILAAQDMAGLDADVFQALSMQMGIHTTQIKGVPLETSVSVTGGITGNMTMTQVATDISTAPIPESKFEVPAGYMLTNEAEFFPATHMPGAPSH